MTVVLLNMLIVKCIAANFFFYFNKSAGFQLCCAVEKKEEKNSGFIAATLYSFPFDHTYMKIGTGTITYRKFPKRPFQSNR